MYKKAFLLASVLFLCLAASCANQTASTASSSAGLSQMNTLTQMTIKDKLGIGILSLEETDLSISYDQAAVLLPLWQAVRSLGADKNAASAEIAALYNQIQVALTADQIAQIDQFAWSEAELVGLVQIYQAQTSQTPSTVKSASSSSASSQGQNMGGGPGGDMLPPDGGIMMGGGAGMGMALGQSTTGQTQQSLIQSQASSKSAVDLNVFLADAVINLLQRQVDA